MKEWRVIIVLLAVIVLLGVILGVKIINNTPEKQMQEFVNDYNETKLENNTNTYFDADEFLESLEKQAQKQAVKETTNLIIVGGLIVLFFTIVHVKIYNKLGIEGLWVKLYVITSIVSFLVVFTFNNTLTTLVSAISAIIGIILLIMEYKVIGVNPYLLLLVFIPIVGAICILIVYIFATCKLADYFNKGTGFKLGLIFLPVIFLPILAFSADA